MNHWTDAHIYKATDEATNLSFFVGEDETGDAIYASTVRSHVVAYLEEYAASLERSTGISFDPNHIPTATLVEPGDILCTEFGEYLIITTNFTSPQQLGLVNLTDHQLVHQTVTGDEIVIDDFTPFILEHDVYQVRRFSNDVPPETEELDDEPLPSGPFRDWNITLSTLQAVNADNFDLAVEAAQRANTGMSAAHVEDFVLYLMEM